MAPWSLGHLDPLRGRAAGRRQQLRLRLSRLDPLLSGRNGGGGPRRSRDSIARAGSSRPTSTAARQRLRVVPRTGAVPARERRPTALSFHPRLLRDDAVPPLRLRRPGGLSSETVAIPPLSRFRLLFHSQSAIRRGGAGCRAGASSRSPTVGGRGGPKPAPHARGEAAARRRRGLVGDAPQLRRPSSRPENAPKTPARQSRPK